MQGGNLDQAFLLAPASLSMSTPTTCAVNQINNDLQAWQVTAGANLPSTIAQQILNALVMEGGLVAMASGINTLGPAQTVGWACATLTAVAGAGTSSQSLIGYAFTAANV